MLERDACGVGVVANIKGHKSHEIIEQGVQVLLSLAHRGATGADPKTGDGAGLLIQMPHDFLQQECTRLGFALPDPGEYGVGMVFLPPHLERRRTCEAIIERTVLEEGLRLLGWRDVPVDDSEIGYLARESQPFIRQVFVGRGPQIQDESHFERKLYVIRKVVERAVEQLDQGTRYHFYMPSLSSNRIVYKGLLMGTQLKGFYPDLSDPRMVSSFALIHARFSTNTLGSWRLAHPYRLILHNGEINTLRGNINWMTARQAMFSSPLFGDEIEKLFPIITPGASDTASFDNALELLLATGRSLPHSLMMMIPEATGDKIDMPQEKRDFYDYHSSLIEPWDGPALIAATDGTRICVILDRNGLRPFRYLVTSDDLLVMASETGVLNVPPEKVLFKNRIQPGRMFLLDTSEGRIVEDAELKRELSRQQPYGQWLAVNRLTLDDLPEPSDLPEEDPSTLLLRMRAFGYTIEDLEHLMAPMASTGAEPIGSMGNDTPLAVLSDRPQILFSYFKQLFAQVSNPPLDAIREELVTSLEGWAGSEQNLFDETPLHCHQLRLKHPVLTNAELEKIRRVDRGNVKAITVSTLFDMGGGPGSLERAVNALCYQVSQAVKAGYSIVVLSDRGVDARHAPIPSLLATAAVHHHLIREGTRMKVGLVVESGEPREVMHFALLIGYGAAAVNPYLAFEVLDSSVGTNLFDGNFDPHLAQKNLIKAIEKGVLKVMSKMGISTVQSYRGAQIFEAVGLNQEFVDRYFTWTASRIQGVGIDTIEEETRRRHNFGYADGRVSGNLDLDVGGAYQWHRDGEYHMVNPETISLLQQASWENSYGKYRLFAALIDQRERHLSTLRSLLDFKTLDEPIPLDEVEPATEIVKRFATGAISLGAISREAHETLA
ncbi:MAG: glutamate synthase subunit alpha, partial [Chloroflexi bacterium]|nr:glutamate synthase subunit alpha [Chloroflexota bacterium]